MSSNAHLTKPHNNPAYVAYGPYINQLCS